jgi:hypothetical protein
MYPHKWVIARPGAGYLVFVGVLVGEGVAMLGAYLLGP